MLGNKQRTLSIAMPPRPLGYLEEFIDELPLTEEGLDARFNIQELIDQACTSSMKEVTDMIETIRDILGNFGIEIQDNM